METILSLQSNQIIGSYRIVRPLGEGGMATVYEVDLKWRLARHAAAVDHALTKTALSQQSKDIFRAYVLDEEPLKCVAKRFGVSENTVAQTKTRVGKMIAALEEGIA